MDLGYPGSQIKETEIDHSIDQSIIVNEKRQINRNFLRNKSLKIQYLSISMYLCISINFESQ